MKVLINYILACLFIFNFYLCKVNALEKESLQVVNQILIANKYAEKFCNAKDDNFFEGLDNEITLKYSYFRYIGLQNEELHSKNMHKVLITQIKEKCQITKKEEGELNEFLLNHSLAEIK